MAPILKKSRELLERLRKHYTQGPVHKDPAISPNFATTLSVALTILFVLPLYTSSKTRPSQTLTRDAPSVIKARIRALAVSCCMSGSVTIYVLTRYGDATVQDALHLLGWWPIDPLDTFRSLFLVCVLFAGPLFEAGLVDGHLRDWISGATLRDLLSTWIGWRNYVAGPITEELLFRSFLTPVHLIALPSPPFPAQLRTLVFTLPLYFGIAHAHHFYEFRLRHPTEPLAVALARVLLQFTYTSVFGFIAQFIFLRTGNVLACMLAHSFCNFMGLPRVWGRVGANANALDELGGLPTSADASVLAGPPEADETKKHDDDDDDESGKESPRAKARPKGDCKLGIGWSVVYYTLLIGGAMGFWKLLYPLTGSKLALGML